MRFGKKNRQVADLRDVGHLVLCDHAADVEEGEAAAVRVRDRAVPLVLAPSVEEVDGPAADAGEVLDDLLQAAIEILVVAGVDGRPDIRGREAVEMSVTQERVHLRSGIEQVEDQPPKCRERRSVPVSKARFIEAEDKVADALRN